MTFSRLYLPAQRWQRLWLERPWLERLWLGGSLLGVLLGAIAMPGAALAQSPNPLKQGFNEGDQAFINNCRQAAAGTNIFTGDQQITSYCTCSLRELKTRYTRADIEEMYADLERQQSGGQGVELPTGMIEIAQVCLREAGVILPSPPSP